jgi:hypothetical protein
MSAFGERNYGSGDHLFGLRFLGGIEGVEQENNTKHHSAE